MSQQVINTGTVSNDGTGTPLRIAAGWINANFTELYLANTARISDIAGLQAQINSIGAAGPNYFGTGADGAYNSSGDEEFVSVIDGAPVVKNFTTFTIDHPDLITVSNRCKGLVIFCTGNAHISGKLSMTGKGAKAVGERIFTRGANTPDVWFPYFGSPGFHIVDPIGGVGGAGHSSTGVSGIIPGEDGQAGVGGACGGGGGGGVKWSASATAQSGDGSSGTSFSGGAGGAGASNAIGSDGGGDGGDGGTYVSGAGSTAGGAGNDGGAGGGINGANPGTEGDDGTGGLLILVVGGHLTISSTGIVSADGADGGTNVAGGGGSGGGSILILSFGNIVNAGTLRANGGNGGAGGSGQDGGNGGAGSIRLISVEV